MPILRYTGSARVFRTASPDDAPEETPKTIHVEPDNTRLVDVDEITADKLLNLGVFEVADDSDDDGEPEKPNVEDYSNFASLTGVGSATEDNLYDAGYETFDDLRSASDEDLLEIDGIGDSALADIRDDLDELAESEDTSESDFDIGG